MKQPAPATKDVGFAVVADEVRKLAERTTQATKQIGSMVKDIQHKTHSAVTDIERGNQVVQDGVNLQNVQVPERHRGKFCVRSAIGLEIATASTQQTAVSETIARRVQEISGMAKTSALYSTHHSCRSVAPRVVVSY